MSTDIYRKVENDPVFKELVARRSRLAVTLSAIVLVSYYAFMAVVAFAPEVFGKPLFKGSALTIGGPIGALLIIVSWLLTGLYVSRANGEFDRMTQEIVERNA
jgi:uncharacterized membrane protein (DUF485 family)